MVAEVTGYSFFACYLCGIVDRDAGLLFGITTKTN